MYFLFPYIIRLHAFHCQIYVSLLRRKGWNIKTFAVWLMINYDCLLLMIWYAFPDTLHRFCKKEHDWGWKKFMELSKVLDGFTVAETLVIKAQVQVIRWILTSKGFFSCVCQYYVSLGRTHFGPWLCNDVWVIGFVWIPNLDVTCNNCIFWFNMVFCIVRHILEAPNHWRMIEFLRDMCGQFSP